MPWLKHEREWFCSAGLDGIFLTTLAEPEHGPKILFSDDLPYSDKKLLELMTLYFHGKGRAMETFLLKDCDGR